MRARRWPWGRWLLETLLILILGSAGGWLLNSLRTEPLPLDIPATQLLTESGARIVTPGAARRLFEEGEYVFVDARPIDDYIESHIEGALSLPTSRFDELYRELTLWSGGQPLLVYGSALEVPVADDLARRLGEAGEEVVVIMTAGFEAWQARGYPVERGAGGLLAPLDAESQLEEDGR
ncbi:MAG: hypothetical protein GF330_01795 [Candidatus Eisenbacteria bacterium]|nr:hypothetical protein [Candidatus Eisenbacteria bacterium]